MRKRRPRRAHRHLGQAALQKTCDEDDLSPPTIADSPRGYKGFTVFETNDIDDIMRYVTEYGLVAKVKVLPILESKKSTELYKKIKSGL